MENQRNDSNRNGIDRPTTTTSATNNVTTATSSVSTTITRPITTSNNSPTTTNNNATTSSNNDGAHNMAAERATFFINDEVVTQTVRVSVVGTAIDVTSSLVSVLGRAFITHTSAFSTIITFGGQRIQLFHPLFTVNGTIVTNNGLPTFTYGGPIVAMDMEPEVFTGDGVTVRIEVVRRTTIVTTTLASVAGNSTFLAHISVDSRGPRIQLFIPLFSVNPQNYVVPTTTTTTSTSTTITRPITTSNNNSTTTTSTSTTITRPITTSNNNSTTSNHNPTTSSNNDGAHNMAAERATFFISNDEVVTQTVRVKVVGLAIVVTSSLVSSVIRDSTFNAIIILGGPRIQLFNPLFSINGTIVTNNGIPTTPNGALTTTPAIDMEPEVFTGDGVTLRIEVARNATFDAFIDVDSRGPRIQLFIPRLSDNPQN